MQHLIIYINTEKYAQCQKCGTKNIWKNKKDVNFKYIWKPWRKTNNFINIIFKNSKPTINFSLKNYIFMYK